MDYWEIFTSANIVGFALSGFMVGLVVKTLLIDRPAHRRDMEKFREEKNKMWGEVLSDRFSLQERTVAMLAYRESYGSSRLDYDL